jgi:hypothetical protein
MVPPLDWELEENWVRRNLSLVFRSGFAGRSRATLLNLFLVNQFSSQISPLDLDLPHLVDGTFEYIPIQHDEVGQLARLERAFFVLGESKERVVDGVKPDRLLPGQRFFRMQ